jgi:hypothetical protein
MTRHAVLLIASVVTCISCAANGPAYLGFELDLRTAPPPPRVELADDPQLVVVEDSDVYVVSNAGPDYDMFRYGSSWYVCYDRYWYRARSYGGPYFVVDVRSVPREVVSVPPGHWKHHPHGGPPGQRKKHDHDEGWGS